MDPILQKSHETYRNKIRAFAEKEIKSVAGELDEKSEFSLELTRKYGEFGLFGIQLSKEYNGQGLDTLSYIIAVEELSRIDASQAATVAAHNSLGIGPIYKYGTRLQKEKYLEPLTKGDQVWGFALTEPTAGSDALGSKTKAELQDGEWLINGSKTFITNSASKASAGITLQAVSGEKNGRKEFTAILVDRGTPGFTTESIHNKLMWRAADTGKLSFTNCKVPQENTLGERGQGARIMLDTLDSGRLSIAAMGLGLAQGAFEMALDYAKEREQFGKPIYKFQSISNKLADMAMKLELARNTLYKACWLKEQEQPFAREAAIAKLYSSEIAKEIADEAVQIHGAYGLFKDHPIERFYRDQRILQIGEGTSEILRMVIARYLGLR